MSDILKRSHLGPLLFNAAAEQAITPTQAADADRRRRRESGRESVERLSGMPTGFAVAWLTYCGGFAFNLPKLA